LFWHLSPDELTFSDSTEILKPRCRRPFAGRENGHTPRKRLQIGVGVDGGNSRYDVDASD